jgi:hypothetical protein
MESLLQLLIGIAIAAASSLITVRLAKGQFRSERWWEKKVAAYERVIDAFHDFKKFSLEHLDAEVKESDLSEERKDHLRQKSATATDEIKRAADIGSFILSAQALDILARYAQESDKIGHPSTWWDYLDAEWSVADKHMKEFILEAKRDLKG